MALGRFLKNVFEPRSIGSTIGDPKRIAQRLRLVAGLLVDVPKGKLSLKTLGLLQEAILDTIAQSPFLKEPKSHGSHVKFQFVGPGKFMLTSSNPGHGFFVHFLPLHLGEPSIEEDLDPSHFPEERVLEEIGGFFRSVRGGVEEIQRTIAGVMEFFENLERLPADVLERFSDPEGVRARERGVPRRTLSEQFFNPFG